MKIIQLYNQQRSVFGGEESVINVMRAALERHGHQTLLWKESSRGIEHSALKKLKAAVSGVYNLAAYGSMQKLLRTEQPDIVHAHSVYPMFSPSVLAACRPRQVPVVLHVHSHILTCPNWYHLRNGKVCELCFGGKAYNCLLTNCRGSIPESAAYALRSGIANRLKLFHRNVTLFVTVSDFLRVRLIRAGFPEDRVEVLPNAVSASKVELTQLSNSGEYVGYSGRLSPEKGVSTLIEAARIAGIPVKIAGDGAEADSLKRLAPSNVEFLGRLSGTELSGFYQRSRFTVMPSRCFETFSLAAAESMAFGKPVIASRIGALPELIQDGVNGLLFEPGDPKELANRMTSLWNDPQTCISYGHRAKQWAEAVCNQESFYINLLTIYERAKSLVGSTDRPRAISPRLAI